MKRRFSNRWNLFRLLFPIIGTSVAAPAPAQYPPICGTNEVVHVGRALAALNMTTNDLDFDKDHGEPKVCLSWVSNALHHPLLLPQKGDELLKAAAGDDAALVDVAAGLLEARAVADQWTSGAKTQWPGLNGGLATALDAFLDSARHAQALLQDGFARLDGEDKAWLAATAFSQLLRVDRADVKALLGASGVRAETVARVVKEEDAFDPEPATTNFLALAARADRAKLLAAARLFTQAAKDLAATAATVADWPAGGATFETETGPIIILPPGDQLVTNSALLILSRAGHTTYAARGSHAPGAANGLLGRPLAAIIDLGGDDRYLGGDGIGPGGALFGVSVICDLSGDDGYKAGYLAQGGALFGVAWLEDAMGQDRYDAWGCSQGAAVGGLGVLRDRAGSDVYNLGVCGQGFAGFAGVGLLVDDAGHDRYLAGNRENDWNRNGGRFLSLAQGFSIGIRGFAGGGVGALLDRGGNDTYVADVYGQGVSYWYSAGILVDAGGNDNYTVYQYGQGTGIHLSLGLLADFDGNDRYTGYVLSQGSGHDFGVGLLFDRAGDDTYVADHHAQGRALNNGLALLCDSAGDDAYFARQNQRAQGIGNNGDHREYGSLALIVDGGGNDQYSCGARNDDRLLRPLYGIVYDYSTNAPFAREAAK